ncbi:MAG: hypothetical protein H0U74_18440 [Bradymonadaceae bacterium]|nr:hypothetical protein [Lujinxingiaceae bacterium]
MSLGHRPRLDFPIALSPEMAQRRIEAGLQSTAQPIAATHFLAQCEITIRKEDRHIWSPHMSVIFESRPDGTHVTGHVGPGLPVWSLFITLYGAFGVFATAGLIFGYSQHTLQQTPWGLGLFAAALLLTILLYGSGKLGERLADPQTQMLHTFLRECLSDTPEA